MKLIVDYIYTKNRKKHILGYWFEAENTEEEENLSAVRKQIFFGLSDNDTKPKYAGRVDDKDTQLVKAIGYKVPAYVRNYLKGDSVAKNLSEYTKTKILIK